VVVECISHERHVLYCLAGILSKPLHPICHGLQTNPAVHG
jgi:hypothetical protein